MTIPQLHDYTWIVVHSSAGKDSQTALRRTLLECARQGYPFNQVVVSHQDLGRMEWAGTRELAQRQAAHYGLRFEVTRYRNKDGVELDLLDYVRKRGKWPDSDNRFCTSEFKRGPGNRLLTMLSKERPGSILQVFGFRADESPARKRKPVFEQDKRASTGVKPVFNWLPIHEWTVGQVWEDIRLSGVPWHPAYDLGMKRLSCCFCVFAPRNALLLSGKANPELLDTYCAMEAEIGHTFQNGRSLSDVREAIHNDETPGEDTEKWNM